MSCRSNNANRQSGHASVAKRVTSERLFASFGEPAFFLVLSSPFGHNSGHGYEGLGGGAADDEGLDAGVPEDVGGTGGLDAGAADEEAGLDDGGAAAEGGLEGLNDPNGVAGLTAAGAGVEAPKAGTGPAIRHDGLLPVTADQGQGPGSGLATAGKAGVGGGGPAGPFGAGGRDDDPVDSLEAEASDCRLDSMLEGWMIAAVAGLFIFFQTFATLVPAAAGLFPTIVPAGFLVPAAAGLFPTIVPAGFLVPAAAGLFPTIFPAVLFWSH